MTKETDAVLWEVNVGGRHVLVALCWYLNVVSAQTVWLSRTLRLWGWACTLYNRSLCLNMSSRPRLMYCSVVSPATESGERLPMQESPPEGRAKGSAGIDERRAPPFRPGIHPHSFLESRGIAINALVQSYAVLLSFLRAQEGQCAVRAANARFDNKEGELETRANECIVAKGAVMSLLLAPREEMGAVAVPVDTGVLAVAAV